MTTRILFVGEDSPGRTSHHRANALERSGFSVNRINSVLDEPVSLTTRILRKLAFRAGYYWDHSRLSAQVLRVAKHDNAYGVLWLDKALQLRPLTVKKLKAANPGLKVVLYHPDDFRGAPYNWCRSFSRCPDAIDLVVTTKSYNVAEYKALGFRRVLFVNNAFDPLEHRPPIGWDRETKRSYDFDVGFIGGYEKDRCAMIWGLAQRGLRVHVTGSFWEVAGVPPQGVKIDHGDVISREYARRIHSTKINLAFLRKQNRDMQTTRSLEIPACGGFMLSERTSELAEIFAEGLHAEFFSGFAELLEKCRFYLTHDLLRETIAWKGYEHICSGSFSNDAMVTRVIDEVRVVEHGV